MADQTNPYTQLGMMGMMMPNPYTQYGGQPLPIPGYMGTPTDAQGNPIASFGQAQQAHDAWAAANPAPAAPTGTTLNSTPQPQHGVGGLQPGQWDGPDGLPAGAPTSGVRMASQPNGMPQGWNQNSNNGGIFTTPSTQQGIAPQQQAPAASAAPQNPIDMRQAYLDALSNPGKVTDPGATVPQAQPLGSPSVMNAFLAANPSGGGSGAGGYNNTGFFSTLNKLRAS